MRQAEQMRRWDWLDVSVAISTLGMVLAVLLLLMSALLRALGVVA